MPAAARAMLAGHAWRGRRLAVGFSGGVDSVVLVHVLRALAPELGYALRAVHVHHGLSPNADRWAQFCAGVCRRWRVPLAVRKVRVLRRKEGLEAAARNARYDVLRRLRVDAVALAHHLDDQAETVLMNLLRGAGLAGASGMPAAARLGGKLLVRPLLAVPREAILDYARRHRLDWIEDESNRDEALTRGFLRRRVVPALGRRFPRWRENLARAARRFAAADDKAGRALRDFLAARGLRPPSERKLVEMLKQLRSSGPRVAIRHDGAVLRLYRGNVTLSPPGERRAFAPRRWDGERVLPLPALGGELRFRRARGRGIDLALLAGRGLTVRLRSGGERLQPDPARPRRTLKNLFQEAGVPPWMRERLPLLYCGPELVWVPGFGVDARYRAAGGARGIVPDWLALVS